MQLIASGVLKITYLRGIVNIENTCCILSTHAQIYRDLFLRESSEPGSPPLSPKRHGCLKVWLILMIISTPYNIASWLIGYYSQNGSLNNLLGSQPSWFLFYFIVFELIYLLGVILVFQWKKAGFWIICVVSVIGIFINYMVLHYPISAALMGLIGILILYGVLRIGNKNKGWNQLK